MEPRTQAPTQAPKMAASFGKYLLDEEIARGGMARVFRARLRGLGGFEKRLVVKQVLPELARDPRFVEMFVAEAKTLVEMSHPNIVPVYELGVVEGVYFLAMELVDGATLAEILVGGPLAPALCTHLGVQVLDALAYAHERFGVVHRDVTPRNIIVDESGHVKLLDFGIAAPSSNEPTEQEVFGSHGYMSPEQLLGDSVGPETDLFAVGAVLYEAVLAKPAFWRGSVETTRGALLNEPLPSLVGEPGVPDELARIVATLLERDAKQRASSALAVERQLRQHLAATHPGGVAHELGERAAAAKASRENTAAQTTSPVGRERDGNGVQSVRSVRTLATSRVMTDWLGEPDESSARDESDDSNGAGTKRLDRLSLPPAIVNAPVSARQAQPALRSGPAGTAPLQRGGGTVALPRRVSNAARGRPWIVALAVVAAIALGVGAWSERGTEPLPPVTHRPTRATVTTGPPRHDPPIFRPSVEPLPAHRATPPSPVALVTRPSPEPIAGPTVTLTITSQPWASVRLDGRLRGQTPALRRLTTGAGSHVLEFDNPALGHQARVPIRVQGGQTYGIHVDLTHQPAVVSIR